MKTHTSLILICATVAAMASAQSLKREGAREYFFLGAQKKDPLPVVKPVVSRRQQPKRAAAAAGAVHLALRYNLLVRDPAAGRWRTVDPDGVLHTGACFGLQFSSNRSGYLYVLAKQSSGKWEALLPSAKMQGESRVIDPGETVIIPSSYCYKVTNPPGDEELFVALSRDPDAVYQLQNDIAGPPPPAQNDHQTNRPDPGTTEIAEVRSINRDIDELSERASTRDIEIVKINDESAKADEPANTVYVANKTSQPASNLVTRIVIHHR